MEDQNNPIVENQEPKNQISEAPASVSENNEKSKEKAKKPIYKRPIFIIGAALVALLIIILALPSHEHVWGEWQTKTAATCTENGTKARTCNDCDEIQTEVIYSAGHSYGEWKTETAATCSTNGTKVGTCNNCGAKYSTYFSSGTEHSKLQDQIFNTSIETPYAKLYSLYQSVLAHQAECDKEFNMKTLLTSMLYGQWIDEEGNYINYRYCYTDYNNTNGRTWYSTNLKTSKISGNTYYFYTDIVDSKLIIGYQDQITEEETDNFIITFDQNSISVLNKNDNKTYTLNMNPNYHKVQKGNAKTAYIYIAKKILSFKAPNSVKVTQCYVDYETETVYATIMAANSFGGNTATEYKLYESLGQYYITDYSHNYSTNIDLDELNQKLQNYVANH